MMKKIFLIIIFLSSPVVMATTEESGMQSDRTPLSFEDWRGVTSLQLPFDLVSPLSPSESFSRSQAVLQYFEVPVEADSQSFFSDLQGIRSASDIRATLSYLDPKKSFSDFARIDSSDARNELRFFQDRRSMQVTDFTVSLSEDQKAQNPSPVKINEYSKHLQAAALNPAQLPLKGLRIALDPGHMGGDIWDERTGKYSHDRNGHKLSEGFLVLQVSTLLKQRFEALGAQVRLTHEGAHPATTIAYDDLPLRPYALKELREAALTPWFNSLLQTAPAGPKLYAAFENASKVQKLFLEPMRYQYFILREDLEARVETIQAFHPDITLIIHLDTASPASDPHGISPKPYDFTKAYVTGGFLPEEFASREDRRLFGLHLVNQAAWRASVALSQKVVESIHSRLNIAYDQVDPTNSVEVAPGVHARNLNVQRKLTGHPTTYLECLYYNDPHEFEALSRADQSLSIDGKVYPYSQRLADLTQAIEDGLVAFVRDYHE